MNSVKEEIRALLKLAGPAVIGHMGHVGLGFVDTIMMGHAGSEGLAAVALGNSLSYVFLFPLLAFLNAMRTQVSHDYGANDLGACGQRLMSGLRFAAWLSLPVVLCFLIAIWYCGYAELPEAVRNGSQRYLGVMLFSGPLVCLFAVLRGFLHGTKDTKTEMRAVLLGNVFNLGLNYLLIFGAGGIPALGEIGCALSTVIIRILMVAWMAAVSWGAIRSFKLSRAELKFASRAEDLKRLGQFAKLGAPMAAERFVNLGSLAIVAVLAGREGASLLAAHQLTLQLVGLAFMICSGIGVAGAIRVGTELGASKSVEAKRAAWTAIGLGGVVSIFVALSLWSGILPLNLLTSDAEVIAKLALLLTAAGFFHLGDGVTTVARTCLHGAKDVKWALLASVAVTLIVTVPAITVGQIWISSEGVHLWWGLALGSWVCASLHLHRLRRPFSIGAKA